MLFRSLDLQRISDENQAVIDEDLLRDPMGIKKSTLFLNYYSPEGLVTALEEYGIVDWGKFAECVQENAACAGVVR